MLRLPRNARTGHHTAPGRRHRSVAGDATVVALGLAMLAFAALHIWADPPKSIVVPAAPFAASPAVHPSIPPAIEVVPSEQDAEQHASSSHGG